MKGSDFLDKLENLDQSLVAGAAEPPGVRPRRRLDWGGFAAAAACLAAICLPLLLMYLINGVAPTIEYGPGSKAGSASHQASSAGDGQGEGGNGLGNSQRDPNKPGGGDGPTAAYSTLPEPQENIMGYGDKYTWTRYTFTEDCCEAYPDGLPAEEYFKYNKQEPESGRMLTYAAWNDSILDKYIFCPFITKASARTPSADGTSPSPYEVMTTYAERIFICLPSFGWPPATAEFRCAEDGSGLCLVQISTTTESFVDIADDLQRDSWNISLTLSREPLLTEKVLASAKSEYNETVVVLAEGAEPITAIGGLNTNRMLMCTLPNGMWCRIAGNFNVPYEYMVTLMNSLLNDTSVLDEIDEKLANGELVPITSEEYRENSSKTFPVVDSSLDYDPLADINPVVYPYIPGPDNNDYASPICTAGGSLNGEPGQKSSEMAVLGVDVNYLDGYEGKPLERYSLDRLDSYDGKNESMGALHDLTREQVEKEYTTQRGAMDGARSADIYKRDQPMHYTFHFTWDDYYVTAVFSEDLTADQLWNFFQQLAGKEQPQGDGTLTVPQ